MARRIVGQLGGSPTDDGVTIAVDEALDAAWMSGWQPKEVARQVRLRGDALTRKAAAHALAANHLDRPVDVRWRAQLDDLTLPVVPADRRWWWAWLSREQLGQAEGFAAVIRLLAELSSLPPIDILLPPPADLGVPLSAVVQGSFHASSSSAADPSAAGTGGGDAGGAAVDPVLERIRALLAKAESTTFEAEATALTAKAQELMTRHAVDSARVAAATAGAGGIGGPSMARIPVDPPYVDAKALLLQHVAVATRCRSVQLGDLSMSTVVGFPDDVRAVELLFTSLLVQAQAALSEAARHAPPGTRVRGQGFRSAFLLSYATRIGARLEEINQEVVDAEAAHDAGFLPVLRSRAAAVDEAVETHFGELHESQVRGGYDALGWAAGHRAADEAHLDAGDLDRGRP